MTDPAPGSDKGEASRAAIADAALTCGPGFADWSRSAWVSWIGPGRKVPAGFRAELHELPWLAQMGVVRFWVHDTNERE